MYWLGLFIAVASVPGYTSVSIPAGWAAMSIVLPLTLWRGSKWTFLHSLFLAFIGFAILTFTWTPTPLDGVFRLWQFILIFLAFNLGTQTGTDEVLEGLATGCVVSSLLSIGQWLGWNPVLTYSLGNESAGLFFNHSTQGQVLALVAIACACFGLWWQFWALLPGIYLSHSRGGWLVLLVGFLGAYFPWPKLILILTAATVLALTYSTSSSDVERLVIWRGVLANIAILGQGIGSFSSLYIYHAGRMVRPENVHNDPLQLIFEFGIGSILLFAIAAIVLSRPGRDEWPTIGAFAFLSFFAFPLFTPISAFLLALFAGRVGLGWDVSRPRLPNSRPAIHLRNAYAKLRHGRPRRENLPIQP